MRHFDRGSFESGLGLRRRGHGRSVSLRARPRAESGTGSGERLSGSREYLASRLVLLALVVFLAGMVLYALAKFFHMVRVRGLDLREIFFVPVGLVIILLVLGGVTRRLLRAIKQAKIPGSSR
ncbi:MAG: hypothetical protein NTX17_00410 [Candidatus Eisenbacteria bacterium]|nr:hypothetical protein [Candidatus Eisenbacteria bacterium]